MEPNDAVKRLVEAAEEVLTHFRGSCNRIVYADSSDAAITVSLSAALNRMRTALAAAEKEIESFNCEHRAKVFKERGDRIKELKSALSAEKVRADQYQKDLDNAAGELRVDFRLAEPGTTVGKLLASNCALKRRAEKAERELDEAYRAILDVANMPMEFDAEGNQINIKPMPDTWLPQVMLARQH